MLGNLPKCTRKLLKHASDMPAVPRTDKVESDASAGSRFVASGCNTISTIVLH